MMDLWQADSDMSKEYQSFKEFYPFYLKEHSNTVNRRLHFIGSSLVLAVVFWGLWSQDLRWLLLTPVLGYGFAWVGHFFFEKNRPATFTYPLYSFAGDWVMWKDTLSGKIRL
jgi:hypothetical protein